MTTALASIRKCASVGTQLKVRVAQTAFEACAPKLHPFAYVAPCPNEYKLLKQVQELFDKTHRY